MTSVPSDTTKANLDQSSDDPKQARSDLVSAVDTINALLQWARDLFGSDGTAETARGGLGLGSAALLDVGAGAADVPTNDDLGALATLDKVTGDQVDSGAATAAQAMLADGAGGVYFGDIVSQSAGRLIDTQVFVSSGTWTKPADCTSVKVTVVGGGGGAAGGASGITGGTSSFGSHCSASGGGRGYGSSGIGGAGGVGSGGDVNLTGGAGSGHIGDATTHRRGGDSSHGNGGFLDPYGTYVDATGYGGGGSATGSTVYSASGGGGGTAIKHITSGLGTTETVTVGAGGAGASIAGDGSSGIVIVEAYS